MDIESVFDIISIQNVFSENIFYRSALQVILKFFKSTTDIFPTILFSFKNSCYTIILAKSDAKWTPREVSQDIFHGFMKRVEPRNQNFSPH